jgi:peptide/nickel transport system permease protein
LVSLSPLDPLDVNLGQALKGSMSAEQLQKVREYWGVDVPILEKYWCWLKDFLRGDMKVSLLYRRPVIDILKERLSSSIWLMGTAWIFSGVFGLALGVFSGFKRGKLIDKIIHKYALITTSIPAFWFALLLLVVFSVWLEIFPIGLSIPIGADATKVTISEKIYHAILPVVTLVLISSSNIILHTREKMIEVLNSDYILFARARGESNSNIIFRHSLRNILLPAITLQFASISEIFGGSILIETVFSYPGIGQATVKAGLGGDIPLLLAITIVTATIVFGGNLVANLLYEVVDPRIRMTKKKEQSYGK